jgi:mono/diheme cytochrome c family protein
MRRTWGVMVMSGCLGFGTEASAVDAEKLFSQKCAVCHGANGEGTATGPAQKGDEFIMTAKPAALKQVIMEGRSGAAKEYPTIPVDMPKGLVSEAEADALVRFLQGDLQE